MLINIPIFHQSKLFLLCCSFFLSAQVLAQETTSANQGNAVKPLESKPLESKPLESKPLESKPLEYLAPIWEVSFGTNQLFEGWFSNVKGILPTTSALIINEFLLTSRISLGLAFNLPMVPSRRVVDGKITESYSAPAVLIGPAIDIFSINIVKRAVVKAQASLLFGTILKKESPVFPLAAFRLKIESGEKSGVYLGVSASLTVNSIGLIYGVIYKF